MANRPKTASRAAAPAPEQGAPPAPVFSSVICHIDELNGPLLRGWALDRAQPNTSPVLHIIVDGQEIETIMCDRTRPDVVAAGFDYTRLGYEMNLPEALADGKPHQVTIRDRWRQEVALVLGGIEYNAVGFTWTWRPELRSYVDGLRAGGFEGWVLRTSRGDPALQGNAMVRITCDGATAGHARANIHRGDVARSLGGASNCGFRFIPPDHLRSSHSRTFGFFLMPENIELQNSPVSAGLVDDDSQRRLLDLKSTVDQLHRDITRVRRQLNDIAPKPSYSIVDYDRWYRLYEPALQSRIAASRPADDWATGPLVSVICPVYRPLLQDFQAAVQSVLRQTYRNLELILVDDNSKDPALTAFMQQAAAADPRVKLHRNRKNLRISGATNVALQAARGEWLAFVDHDDLLADVALECMVAAAMKTGAQVLYSDEDKVDSGNNYSEPALKPDWNHRMMLGVNYVCHLLFVARALSERAGPLDSSYDGAQDHDYILRLSEHVASDKIHHVPEILYHWRLTPGSTSGANSNKSYAVMAGQRAVSGHLARIGRPATVTVLDGQTWYRERWSFETTPHVSIIIPYKDEIATTERCLNAVLEHTDYAHYDVILIDNWSTSQEAIEFADRVARLDRVRIMRIEAPFNYSLINNRAAHSTSADYYVFMNNDLFVQDAHWLETILGEAESDPSVGAVGGKFYYPDGTIQHAGVVTGVGGVAAHAHVGLRAGDLGYGGRTLFAQEMSAVTAAGVLVRASAFKAVGGFDETALTVAFNDVDLCMKLRIAGYKIIWSPDFVAEHHESLSRGDDERPIQEQRFFHEMEVMKERYGTMLAQDPFHHPLFSLDRQAFFDLKEPGTTFDR